MSLIKLSGVPHPEINDGQPAPVYIDPTRVLIITRAGHRQTKLSSQQLKIEAHDDLYSGVRRMAKLLVDKMPDEIDTQEAAKWTREIHMANHDIQDAYNAWGRAYRADDFYPMQDCTEVQLACGTGLEHGVMLARVWVSETPEEVHEAIKRALDFKAGLRMVP